MRSLFGVAAVLLLVATACSGDSEPSATPPPTATATESPQPAVQFAGPPPETLPAATDLLRAGDDVSFRVCGRTLGWQRPSPAEMQRIFTNNRFGDGAVPFPLDYAYYLRRVYYVQLPTANSANIEWSAFSGFANQGERDERLCDPPDTRDLVKQYGAPAKSALPWYQPLQLVEYHLLDMKRRGPDLVVQVEEAPGTHEAAYFPYPAGPNFFDSALGFNSLQVVDTSGNLLYTEARNPFVEWFEHVQYGPTGEIDAMVLGGATSINSTQLEVPPGQRNLTLYAGVGLPLEETPAGSLLALDASGAELKRVSWAASGPLWEPLASIDLPPETRRVRIETAGVDDQQGFWSFVLIRDGVPLPPGVPQPGE
jgi:hypothetical protein